MHFFLCIWAVKPNHIQEVISQHLIEISTKCCQYSNAYDLLSDHLCQVVPKLQSRSHIMSQAGPKNCVLKTDVGYTHAMPGNSNKYLHVRKCKD